MTNVLFKGSSVEIKGDFPKLKDLAPEFNLVDSELKEVQLSNLGKIKKVLSIVPSLDTQVCISSARKFYEMLSKRKDVVLLVISEDLPFAQKRNCEKESIAQLKTLSTMRDRDFSMRYGVKIATGPLAGLCARAVLVLDENNRVIYSELVPEITHEPNYKEVEAALSR